MRHNDAENELGYVSYALVVPRNIKEGKSEYKKTEKLVNEISVKEFIETFVAKFSDYSKHQIESWFLNAVKNAAFNPINQPSHRILSVSDFAQNITNDRKKEVSEERFHKTQTALFGTVSSFSTHIQPENEDCKTHSVYFK